MFYRDDQSAKTEADAVFQKLKIIVNIFNYRSFGYTCTKCFKRRLYTENKIYIPKLGMHEDIYIMSQIIFYAKSIVYLPEVLYHYRKDNPDSLCSQSRTVRHIASSRNMLDLCAHYLDHLKGSPIEGVWGGLVLRGGWHAIVHKEGRVLWNEFPWLAEAVRKAPLGCGYRTPLIFQLVTKLYISLFRPTR